MKEGNKFGAHRVLEPKGVLPQPAWRIENTMERTGLALKLKAESMRRAARSRRRPRDAAGSRAGLGGLGLPVKNPIPVVRIEAHQDALVRFDDGAPDRGRI